jgi:hypothetical protein
MQLAYDFTELKNKMKNINILIGLALVASIQPGNPPM